jgi:virulence factor
MNYANGVTEEIIEVAHPHKKSIVRNLASFEVYDQGAYMTEMPNDWLPTLKKRGFMDMTQAFIEALRNQSKSPIDPLDALRSHEICELIVKEIERN